MDTPDLVNDPPHYTKGLSTFEYIDSWNMEYAEGCIIKYVTRWKYKGAPLQDLQKARWYLDKLIKQAETWNV